VAEDKDQAKKALTELLRKLLDEHLRVAGIGFISEVFNGDPPHEPNGCIAQAWNSAELIRLWTLINEKPDVKVDKPGAAADAIAKKPTSKPAARSRRNQKT